jgi:hypothetical protein
MISSIAELSVLDRCIFEYMDEMSVYRYKRNHIVIVKDLITSEYVALIQRNVLIIYQNNLEGIPLKMLPNDNSDTTPSSPLR